MGAMDNDRCGERRKETVSGTLPSPQDREHSPSRSGKQSTMRPKWQAWIVGVIAILIGVCPAKSQPPFSVGPDESPVTLSAQPKWRHVARGEEFPVAVIIEHAINYHTWPNQPVVPPGFEGLNPIATEIVVGDLPQGLTQVGAIQWPKIVEVEMKNPYGRTVQLQSYAGTAIAFVTLKVADDAPLGVTVIPFAITYQTCDDSTCLAPEFDVPVTTAVEIVEAAPISRSSNEALFASYDRAVTDQTPPPTPAPVAAESGESQRLFLGFIPVPENGGAVALVLVCLLAFAGGAVLNLTPCVLPVIPIKVMTLTRHGGSRERTLFLGLMMALGVVAFWVGISIPVVLLQSFSDPSQLFAIWWVTLSLGALIAVLSLGLMGMFTFNLPQGLYLLNPKANTPHGSFLFGVMTAVLGLPCFGFVAGALLGAIVGQPRAVTIAVFASLGAGMAAPYLVLAAFPRLIDRIPRTGPASELVKQVMGLLMLGAGAFFIGSGLAALVKEEPTMGKVLHWWFVALFCAAAGVWLIVRTFKITRASGKRVTFGLIGLILAAGPIYWAQSRTEAARNTFWVDFDLASFDAAIAQKKTVVLDFTADWCLNCKVARATVLDRDDVRRELRTDDVVAFEVDLTSRKAPGWAKLKELGETGIPLLVVLGPGLDEPWKRNAYTPSQVLDALQAARGPGR